MNILYLEEKLLNIEKKFKKPNHQELILNKYPLLCQNLKKMVNFKMKKRAPKNRESIINNRQIQRRMSKAYAKNSVEF